MKKNTTKKRPRGAQKGNSNAKKENPMTGIFPRFWHWTDTVNAARKDAAKRKQKLSEWLREAVDARLAK